MMTKTVNIREVSLEALLEILEKKAMSHLVTAQALKKYQYLDKQDRAFFSRLTEGTLERLITLDYVLEQFSSVPVKKMKPVIRTILRMGAYQLLYMDSVPDSAACNESVRLAERKGFRSLKGFVNGVLRSIAREKDKVLDETAMSLSVRYSTPEWIVEKWISCYGNETAERMLKASFEEKKTTVRCNLNRATKEEIIAMLEQEQVKVEECRYPSYALALSEYDYLEGLTAFVQGYISVQDISSMMVAEAAAVQKNDRVLDVCAAPGGKSTHLAEKLKGTGLVEARDLTEYKTELIEQNIVRTGLENIRTRVWDAREFDTEWEQKADVVLADLPCSGLGVIGRKNDLKYRITEDDCRELAKLQRQILDTVSRYVRPGGTLIYSTCTVNPGENQENVKWLTEHLPFETESLLPYLPDLLKADMTEKAKKEAENGSMTFLQGVYPTDGFFLARLKRKAE